MLQGVFFLPLVVFISNTYAIKGGFGDTEWVGKDKWGVEVWVYGTNNAAETKNSLVDTIKNFVNWTLRILALITLLILLWGGFQMLLAAGDEGKFKQGFTILKQAAVALAFIGLSWLLVSFIFWLISTVAVTKSS